MPDRTPKCIKRPNAGGLEFGLVLFVVLSLEMVFAMPSDVDGIFTAAFYLLDYSSWGFNYRFFIGSLISLFTDYVSSRMFMTLLTVTGLVMIALVSLYVGKIAAKSSLEERKTLGVFVALFAACPVSVNLYFTGMHFGRFELFLIIFSLLALICLKGRRMKWLVPVICVCAVLTYEVFAITFFVLIAAVLLYRLVKSGFARGEIVFCAVTVLCVAATLGFVFFGAQGLNGHTESELIAFIEAKSNFKISSKYVANNLSQSLGDYYYIQTVKPISEFALKYAPIMVAYCAPIAAIFVPVWRGARRRAESGAFKFFYVVACILPLSCIVVFVTGADWDRWISSSVITQFLLLFFLLNDGDSPTSDAAREVADFFLKRRALFFALLVIFVIFWATGVPQLLYSFISNESVAAVMGE